MRVGNRALNRPLRSPLVRGLAVALAAVVVSLPLLAGTGRAAIPAYSE